MAGSPSAMGSELRMHWRAPLAGAAGAGAVSDGGAALQDYTHIPASSIPFHPLVMAGRYHMYRMTSKYPVPGGAVQDDLSRRKSTLAGGSMRPDYAAAAADARRKVEQEAEISSIAAQLQLSRGTLVLPKRDDDELPGVRLERDFIEEEEFRYRMLQAPRWPANETFPAGEAELQLFKFIQDNDIEGLRRRFTSNSVPVDVAHPLTGMTGVMRAAQLGRFEILQMYLAADAAVNKKSASGETALHYAFDPCKHMPNTPSLATALRRRVIRLVHLLLSHGALPNVTNTAGDMPLHLAARYDVAGAATRFLMQCGEETIERPNHAGVTPFAVAQQRGSSEVLYIFANWRIILRQRTIARMTGEITETGRATMNPSHAVAVKERVAQIVGAQAQSTGAVEDDTGGVAAGEMVFAGLSKIDERSLPADALIQRWRLLEDWSSQKRARADAILDKRSAHATLLSDSTVPVAEYDVQHGKLRPLAKAEAVDAEARDDLVYKARALLNASTAGATSSWLTPGTFGQEVAQRAREQIENNELSDDDVSVGAVAEDQDLDEVALSTGADALDRKAKSAAKKAHKLHLARTLVDVYTPAEEHTQVMLSTLRGTGALQPSAPTHPPVELFPEIVARKRLTVEDSELAHTVLQPMLPMQARREQYATSLALTKSGQPGTRVRQAGEGGAYLPSHAPSETTSLALAVRSDSGGSMRGGEHDERSAIVPFKPYLGERDEDEFEDALGTGVQALMQATDAMPEYVKQSKISERRLRTRHWQHAVALAAEHDLAVSETASMRSRGVVSDASSVASAGGEEGMLATTRRRLRSESESVAVDTTSSPLAARRRRIAQAVLGDVPGLEYNMEYSHIVDGQVYTRRPALLTKTLTATRYRLDNRPNVGSQDVSSSMSMAQLQSLVVGTDDPTQRVEAKKVSMFSPTSAAARRAERG